MDSKWVPNRDPTEVDPSPSLARCAQCEVRLPLRGPQPGEQAAAWLCAGCGARYSGVLDRDCGADLRQHILLAPLRFTTSSLAPPPKVTADFIAARVGRERHGREHRAHPRQSIAAPVAALPLDAYFLPAGAPFMGMAHSLSTSGIGLIHTRAVTAPQLGLKLSLDKDHEIRAVIVVTRCRAVGLFYEIAGPFLVRIAPTRPLS
ncbi:MAG: hypothetical protein A2W31_12655 [Planctomycetes bacterium RBG_16_64_10]|nr:MAG: hypothetical protein A2W31_12655 [Planctomycetes bacterium RBG_16_64_10]